MNGRGRQRELAVLKHLKDGGFVVYRLAQGPADLIVLGGDLERPLLVQVKSTARAYERFVPMERQALLDEAEAAGADPMLAWWPKGKGEPVFIDSKDWPPIPLVLKEAA